MSSRLITNNLTKRLPQGPAIVKRGVDTQHSSLKIMRGNVYFFSWPHIEVNKNIVDQKIYDYLFTVEEVNKLVQEGVPFRDAYKIVGGKVVRRRICMPDKEVVHTHIGSVGNLGLDRIKVKMKKANAPNSSITAS